MAIRFPLLDTCGAAVAFVACLVACWLLLDRRDWLGAWFFFQLAGAFGAVLLLLVEVGAE